MDTSMYEKNYYQCSKCGNIHHVKIDKVFDLCDELYYATFCAKCRDFTKHLCLGADEGEKYELADPVLDQRYYD